MPKGAGAHEEPCRTASARTSSRWPQAATSPGLGKGGPQKVWRRAPLHTPSELPVPGLGLPCFLSSAARWRAVTARKETTLFTANLQSDGVETDPSMFLPDETGNSFHRKGLVYALGVCEIDDCTAFLPLPCPAQGYHVALPRPPSCSGQSWAPHASPCTPGLLTSEAPEWGGAIWGQDKKSQPSKEGGCLGSGGFTAFLQTAENFRWPELRQAAETLRSLSRRDERGNCGIFITRQLGLREVY